MALVYDTAWLSLLERGRFRPGDCVFILGATGGVGLAAIQLVKALGGIALAGVSDFSKVDTVTDAGADFVIDMTHNNLRESLREQVFKITNGKGADIVVDALGDKFFEAAIRTVAWCGRYVVIGFAAGSIPSLKVNYVLVRNIEISGLQIGDYRKRAPEKMQDCFDQIFELYDVGKIGPLPFKTLPLKEFGRALRSIRDRTARGRIV
jgi:NADPH2:quinone reductase